MSGNLFLILKKNGKHLSMLLFVKKEEAKGTLFNLSKRKLSTYLTQMAFSVLGSCLRTNTRHTLLCSEWHMPEQAWV